MKLKFYYFNYLLLLSMLIIGLVFMTGCQSKNERAKQFIGEKVVVVVNFPVPTVPEPSKVPNIKGHNSSIFRHYSVVHDGKLYTAFFSSISTFNDFFNPPGIHSGDNQPYEIDRNTFIEQIDPQEECIFNIGQPSEMTFIGEELRQIFPD